MIFAVNGTPVAQGSHKAFVIGGKARITDAKPGLKPWRAAIAAAAAEERGDAPLLEGPVKLSATFIFPRPKSHYYTGKRAGVLREDAPAFAISRQLGDADKHARSLGDALTGVLFHDDSQIAKLSVQKRYGSHSFCTIEVIPLEGDVRLG